MRAQIDLVLGEVAQMLGMGRPVERAGFELAMLERESFQLAQEAQVLPLQCVVLIDRRTQGLTHGVRPDR